MDNIVGSCICSDISHYKWRRCQIEINYVVFITIHRKVTIPVCNIPEVITITHLYTSGKVLLLSLLSYMYVNAKRTSHTRILLPLNLVRWVLLGSCQWKNIRVAWILLTIMTSSFSRYSCCTLYYFQCKAWRKTLWSFLCRSRTTKICPTSVSLCLYESLLTIMCHMLYFSTCGSLQFHTTRNNLSFKIANFSTISAQKAHIFCFCSLPATCGQPKYINYNWLAQLPEVDLLL